MLNIKVWTMSLGCWMAATFTICVLGGVIAPDLPIPHRTLELLLPAFRWISWGSFVLGLVETFVFGVYAGWLLRLSTTSSRAGGGRRVRRLTRVQLDREGPIRTAIDPMGPML